MNLHVRTKAAYGKQQNDGLHVMVDSALDITGAFDRAATMNIRDVYLYVSDLTWRMYITEVSKRRSKALEGAA